MLIRVEERDADLPILAYLMMLAALFAGFAYGLVWLLSPRSVPNPGLAAYKPPTGISLVVAKPHDPSAIESAELLVAAEANVGTAYAKAAPAEAARDAAKPEPTPKRTAQSNTRKRVTVERTVAPRPFEERRPMWGDSWGFAQQRATTPNGRF
jgi:hypothetical protein